MAVTDFSAKIAALIDAIGDGTTTISYEGKSVTYKSLAEMQSTVAYLQRQQARATGQRVSSVGMASFDRGYQRRGC